MNVSRRDLLKGCGAVAVAAALPACSSKGGSSSASEKANSISFWSNHPGSSKDIEQKLIKAYMDANPDQTVTLVDAGNSYEDVATKFNAALAGRAQNLPGVVVASDVTWFNFALNGAIAPMDDLWSPAGIKPTDYVDSFISDYQYDKKHYGIPYSRSTCLFYYNTDMWAKAGLPNRGPQTWEEFDEFAVKLKAANGDAAPLLVPDGSNYLDWYFQGMIWTFGGQYSKEWKMTFTDQNSIMAGKFLADQVKKGHIRVEKDPGSAFGSGLGAALLQSTGALGGLKKQAAIKFNTAFLPGPKPGCATGGAGLAIPAKISDERKANAMKFIAFVTNAVNTTIFSQGTGYMPVRKDALATESEKKYLAEEPRAMTAIKQLTENTRSQDYARVFLPGGGLRIGQALDKVTTGSQPVEQVFAGLQKESQEVYERDIKPKLH